MCSWTVGRGGLSELNVRILTVRAGGTVVSDGSWCYHYQLHTSGSPSIVHHCVITPGVGARAGTLAAVRGNSTRNSGFMLQLLHT